MPQQLHTLLPKADKSAPQSQAFACVTLLDRWFVARELADVTDPAQLICGVIGTLGRGLTTPEPIVELVSSTMKSNI
jgi:hypothetical protein